MQLSVIGQTESINYQNFSKNPLTTLELQRIAKILPQAESYYWQNKIKDSIITTQKKIADSLFVVIKKKEQNENHYISIIELKNKEIEAVKPKWWQEPFVIGSISVLSVILGVLVAK